MFIQTEAQPNPTEMKFLPGRQVLGEGMLALRDRGEAARSPLAAHLFEVEGVAAVLLGPDFITVTRSAGEWPHLKPAILGTIMQHFMSGEPVLAAHAPPAAQGDSGTLAESIRDALRQVIYPELGYNIVDLGLVYAVHAGESATTIIMTTTTRGCPATNYLKEGAGAASRSVAGAGEVEVVLSYDPPWQPGMMSDEAKQHFGITDEGGW